MTLLRWLTFLLGSQTVILIILLFWIYFLHLMLVFVLQWLCLHWEILMLSQFPLTFQLIHNRMPISSHSLWLFSCWLGWSPWSFERCSIGASASASEFCEWVQVGIHVYIPHKKYQVKPHSSPWFSAACAAVIVHRNHFFRLYQREKSSDSKVKFRQASNCSKMVLKAAKLSYAHKTKEYITSHKLGSRDFWRLANSVLNKGKSVYLFYSTAHRCCFLRLIKQNCLLKIFLWTIILMTQLSLYLFSLLKLILNCIIFL